MHVPSAGDLSFGIKSDCVVALWGPHAGPCVGFAVQLPPHEEVALLFEVEVTVSTHEALWMPMLVPHLHNRTTVGGKGGLVKKTPQSQKHDTKADSTTDKAGVICFTFRKQ